MKNLVIFLLKKTFIAEENHSVVHKIANLGPGWPLAPNSYHYCSSNTMTNILHNPMQTARKEPSVVTYNLLQKISRWSLTSIFWTHHNYVSILSEHYDPAWWSPGLSPRRAAPGGATQLSKFPPGTQGQFQPYRPAQISLQYRQ